MVFIYLYAVWITFWHSLLAFYLTFYSGRQSGIYSDSLSDIYIGILSGISLSYVLTYALAFYPTFYSAILSGIYLVCLGRIFVVEARWRRRRRRRRRQDSWHKMEQPSPDGWGKLNNNMPVADTKLAIYEYWSLPASLNFWIQVTSIQSIQFCLTKPTKPEHLADCCIRRAAQGEWFFWKRRARPPGLGTTHLGAFFRACGSTKPETSDLPA